MQTASRKWVRAAVAAACLFTLGGQLALAQPIVIERGAMPAPRVEVVPVAPGPGYNWVPGHWAWRHGGWEWIRGHHIRGVVAAMPAEIVEVVPARPSPAHVWVKGHHVFEGGGWVWHPGVWVRL